MTQSLKVMRGSTKSAHFGPDRDSQTVVNGASYVGRERNGATLQLSLAGLR